MKKQVQKIINKKKITLLLLAFIGSFNFQVNGQTVVTFLETAPNGEWQTTTNWDTGLLPGTTDQAWIKYAGDLTLDADRTIGNLRFSTNTARSFLDAGSNILTLDNQVVSTSRLIDNSTSRAITIYPSINFTTSGVIYNRNKNGYLTFTGGTIYINSNTITTDSRSTNSTNQYIVFNGPVDGDGIINVDDSQNAGATKGISLSADANFSTFTGTINAKNNPIVSSTTNAFGSALTLDGSASFEINVASTFTGSISRLATTAGAATVTFNANQSMGSLSVDTQNLAMDFDAAATAVEFTGYMISGTEGVVDLQNYVSGTLRIGTTSTSISQTILDTWTVDGAADSLLQDENGFIIQSSPTINGTYTNADGAGDGKWTTASNWTGSILPSTDGIATIEANVDIDANTSVGALLIPNAITISSTSNSTLTLTKGNGSNNIIENNSAGLVTFDCDISVDVASKRVYNALITTTKTVFATGNTIVLGSNTFVIDNDSPLPVEIHGVVTGSGLINLMVSDSGGRGGLMLGANSDLSGFTGDIRTRHSPILHNSTTVIGSSVNIQLQGTGSFVPTVINTFEGNIDCQSSGGTSSRVTFTAGQNNMGSLTVDTRAVDIDFNAAAVVDARFSSIGTMTGAVDLLNYESSELKIGTNNTAVSQTILNTWTIDGAAINLVQDENGFIIQSTITNGTYTNEVDTGDGTWATTTNWTDSTLPDTDGVAIIQRTIDLGGVDREVGQVEISGNINPKTLSNGTLVLSGTPLENWGLSNSIIIMSRSNKTITIDCNVTVNFDDGVLWNRDIDASQLIFNTTGTFALGANTINVDNLNTSVPAIPIEFNGAVTGTGSLNIISQSISLGASADFSGFTGSITFGGTNGLLTVNGSGTNTIEGSIGVLAASDGNSKIEFKHNQTGLAYLSVDTQALAIDFDAAATAVEFIGYTTSGTEGVVDLQNYVSGSLKIGTTSTSVDSAILDTWTLDGASADITQDTDGSIIFSACTEATDVTNLAVSAETTTTIDLSWVNSACFDDILVVAKVGSAVTITPSGDGTDITANAAFGTAGTDANLVANEFAVFKGTAETVSVTGLTTNTDYYFEVFTRKGTDWSDGVVINEIPNSFTSTANGTWEDPATWVGGVIPSTATDNVTVNHNLTIESDVTVNDLTIADGGGTTERLTVEAGFSITVNGDAATRHQLIANSTATSFASLIFSTTGSTTSNIAYNRYINSHEDGNDLISSPVPESFATIAGDFFANPSDGSQILFGPFDNTAGTFTNWDTDDSNGNLVIGKGYRAAKTTAGTVQFKDAITSPVADITVSITDGNHETFGEWNLIGNPFPSYLNFGTFFDGNSNEFHLENVAVYGWNGTNYTVWNGANSSDKLAPGQGFFVRTKDGVSGTVTFTPAMRTTGNSNDFVTTRSGNNNKALAKINLSKLTKTYSTNVYFIENQTKGLDFGYDAGAFSGSATGIYTNLVEDNTGLALGIQSLPYNDYNNVVVPVVINSESGVELKISLDQASLTIPENTYVYLKDNLLNTTTLLNDVDYLFTPDTVLSGAGRFFVEFSANILATDEFAVNEMLIYTNHATKSIIIKGLLKTDANAKVFDIQGRMVLEQKIESSNITNVINVNSLNTGVYIVKLESRTQKIIIK